MFKRLKETILTLNNGEQTAENKEKATSLKVKLLVAGWLMTVLGFIISIVCLGVFANALTWSYGFADARTIIAICFFVFCGVVCGLGIYILVLGFRIKESLITVNTVSENTSKNYCPECKGEIEVDDMFCAKCGAKLKKECPNCKAIYNTNDTYCKHCGEKL